MKIVSIAEAKNHLPSLVHEAEEGSIIELTRHGNPVAILFSIEQYEELKSGKSGFKNKLNSFLTDYSNTLLTEQEFSSFCQRSKATGRKVEF